MNFVTLNVEPQIKVIAMRYRSALGNTLRLPLWVLICLILFVCSCDKKHGELLPDDDFERIYGEILFLGELHRGDTLQLREAIDSLLHAHDTDTTQMIATARELTKDPKRLTDIYRNIVSRLEQRQWLDSNMLDKPYGITPY